MENFVFENSTRFYFGKGQLEPELTFTVPKTQTVAGGIDALDAWTREVGAHRTLAELGVVPDQINEIAASVACLPTGFKQLTTDDVAAILRESM